MMNIVFMGTPSFAVPALRALAADKDGRFAVQAVFSRPDAASGRGTSLLPSPVRLCAEELGVPVLTPPTLRDSSAPPLAHLAAIEPDVIVVAAYGMILPRQVLELPRLGCVNIHASLLPRWRGAAPIQRAILAGDEQSGVSIMRMEEGLDTGAVCGSAAVPIVGKNAREVTAALAALGAELLLEALPRIADGSAVWTEQDESQANYADKVEKHELALRPADAADLNLRRVLASTPQAPARCVIAGRTVTVLTAQPAVLAPPVAALPGEAHFSERRFILTATDGAFEVISLKPDGKKEMPAAAFAAGVKELHRGAPGPATWDACVRGVG